MTWRDSVLDAMRRSASKSTDGLVYRTKLIEDELGRIVYETGSIGLTPAQTLSSVLQEIRDEGEIEFVDDNGVYRLVEIPINVEDVDLTKPEIDSRIRAMTLQNYGNQCALCDISEPSLLIASHIVPWSLCEEARGDLSNVMCLCRFHDVLFELGFWSLDAKYDIIVKPAFLGWPIVALLPETVTFRLPDSFEPSKTYLINHRQRHEFSG